MCVLPLTPPQRRLPACPIDMCCLLWPTTYRGSPTSQKVSFEQLRRGASMDLAACLQMENRMVRRARLVV